jgi:hypothetical protein
MAIATVSRTEHIAFWQILLSIFGAIVLASGVVLEIVLLSYHSTSTTITTGGTIVTTTGPSAPSASLVTSCIVVGAVLILAASFFSRISKVSLPGGYELDFENSAKLAAAIAQKTSDPAVAERLYMSAAPRAAAMVATPLTVRAGSGSARFAWNAHALDDQTAGNLVDEVAG